MVTDFRLLQEKNVASSILVTALGMVIAVILLHSRNASFPMLFTELGILTDFRLVQYSNVLASIVVISLGILIDIRLLQLENLQLVACQRFLIKMVEK